MQNKVKIIFAVIALAIIALIVVGIIGLNRNQKGQKCDKCLDLENAGIKGKLIIILLDGVRHDYVTNDTMGLNGFYRLEAEGVKADYNVPIYPANSYPNWYAIATGLYGESHGMVQNYMYDRDYDDLFLMAPDPDASKPHWWSDAEPIWIRAEKSGIKTVMFNWDGCQVMNNGTKVTKCLPFRDSHNWTSVNNDTTSALRDILEGLKNDSFGLGMVYYQPIDYYGHKYGPTAPETRKAVRDANKILETLQNDIKSKGLSESVNIYIVSDHGMSKPTKKIQIDKLINFDDVYYMMDKGSFAMIEPTDPVNGSVKIHDQLTKKKIRGLNVYYKDEILDEMHLKNHRLILPIVLRTDPDYIIDIKLMEGKVYPNKISKSIGYHGYWAKEFDQMNGIMYAKGPSFKSGYKLSSINQVDHYQVFCKILGLDPKPHNGSWDSVKDMLLYG